MATLGIYLDAIISLKERVGIRTILSALVDRLASHVEASGSDTIPPEANAFKLMNDCVTKLTMERANMTLVETLNLLPRRVWPKLMLCACVNKRLNEYADGGGQGSISIYWRREISLQP